MTKVAVSSIGIENLAKLAVVGCKLANVAAADLHDDGKVGTKLVFGALPVLKDLFEIDFSQAVPEFGDLDAAEAKSVSEKVALALELPVEAVEQKIEKWSAFGLKQYVHFKESIGEAKELLAV